MEGKQVFSIPLHVQEPSGVARSQYPITAGVPVPRGVLLSTDHVRLVGPSGEEMPLQVGRAATWPDGSIKWMHLDFQVNLAAGEEVVYTVCFGEGVERAQVASPLRVRDWGKRIDVVTGPLRFSVDKTRFGVSDVRLDLDGDGEFAPSGQMALEPGELFVELEDVTGRLTGRYLAGLDDRCRVTVEQAGPMRAEIRAEGWHRAEDGRSAIPFAVRIVAYANCPFFAVYHTFTISENPAEVFVKALGIEVPVALNGDRHYAVSGDEVHRGTLAEDGVCTLYQDAPEHYTVTSGSVTAEGAQSGGWLDLNDGEKGLAVFIRDMDKLYPKALRADGAGVTVYLWPEEAGRLDLRLELTHPSPEFEAFKQAYPRQFRMSEHGGISPEEAKQVFTDDSGRTAMGVAKTHELVVYLHKGDHRESGCEQMGQAFNRPLLGFVSPEWYIQTDALGKYHPYDPERFPKLEVWFEKQFEWMIRHQHEWSRWYGMMDYGDTQTRRDMVPGDWARFCCRWGWLNSEVEIYLTAFLQYLRTRDRKYFDFGEALARHHMDVDTIHYHKDPKFIGMGHRHDINHWGGGPGCSHQWVQGTLLYYYLTGYGRALDVANLIGEYFLGQPMRLAIEEGNASREAVNGWVGLARLWEATGDERYRMAAEEGARSYRQNQLPNGLWHRLMIGYMAPAIVTWYLISGSEDCQEMMRRFKSFDFKVLQTALGNPAPLYAYQYRLTGDVKYLAPGYREVMLNVPECPDEVGLDSFKQARVDVVGGLIYFMAALHDCKQNLDGYLPKTGGLEAVTPLDASYFVPLDLREAVNRDPYRSPFNLRDVPPINPVILEKLKRLRSLEDGEIGFQFSHPSNPVRPGYHLVTAHSVYPTRVEDPPPDENFVGYPFGANVELGGVPFDLVDPGQNEGRGVIVLDIGESVEISVGRSAKRAHFLGQVYRRSPQNDLAMFADVEVARYEIHYADGSLGTVPLRNNREMEDFKSSPYARDVRLVRDLNGRWATGHLNVFTFEPENKAIERILFVDSGAGYNPALLGVTLECEGEAEAVAGVRTVRFGTAVDSGVTGQNRYSPETGCGWLKTGRVVDAEDRVLLKGETLLRVDLPNGDYCVGVTLQSESEAGASVDLSIDEELRLDNVEIAVDRVDRFTLPAVVEDGCLLLGIRVNGMLGDFEELALCEIGVAPASEGTDDQRQPEAKDPLRFGWDDISSLSDAHYRNGGIICPDIQARKLFTVDLPNGRYDVELDMITWYPGHPVHVDIEMQGERVAEALHLGEATCSCTVDVTDGMLQVAVETNLDHTHSRAPRWEIRALRVRPVRE